MSKGWVWLQNMQKPHYIGEDSRSLCGKWMSFSTDAEEAEFTNAESCASCKKKLEKLKAKDAKAAAAAEAKKEE